MVLAVILCITPMGSRWAPRLLYNASDSVPRGWYLLVPSDALAVGDLVAVRLPVRFAHVAAARGYLPIGVPLLKRIAAAHAQEVCVHDEMVYVDGVRIAQVRRRDGAGRALHGWSGCRPLRRGEIFLLGDHEASFDSRYIGPLTLDCVIARAVKLRLW
jgi:conjugative transfer signal peptidase TraF